VTVRGAVEIVPPRGKRDDREVAMALPTISVDDRKIVLLSGFKRVETDSDSNKPFIVIVDERELVRSVKNENDAVAYGYVAGRWISAA
jgi:hypothetical protein